MRQPKLLAVVSVLIVFGGLTAVIVFSQSNVTPLPETVAGVVSNADGPVADAIVQVQGTPDQIRTDANGAFSISGLSGTESVAITAWTEGHYIGWVTLDPNAPNWGDGTALNISLRPLPQDDHPEYDWFEEEGVKGSASCALCHREYPEWQQDQHGRAANNHRFLNMYTGTDANGEMGQPVQWGSDGLPELPDPDQPYTGPGFVPDNPGGRAGNCAACHTPLVSKAPTDQNCTWSGCHTNLTIERAPDFLEFPGTPISAQFGLANEGISCEFCHKISDVYVDEESGLPYAAMPGILSVKLHRPETEDDQVFFGPLVDVTRNDSYLPLISESRFCAGCHFGVFGGVMGVREMTGGEVIYNSYGEWLDSPYSDPETGQSCQDCHMPPAEENWFVFAERDGLTRDYVELHNHTMLGAADEAFLQNAVTLVSSAQRDGDQLTVAVQITNDRVGHHIPTGAPMRSMMLVVEAVDAEGRPLELSAGPVNPDFAGDYGGLPGKTFAKVLRDNYTGETPTVAFWRQISLVEDNRLPALATDATQYTFALPADVGATVNVRLIFRRAFYDLMQQKGWNDPDIHMASETLHIPPRP